MTDEQKSAIARCARAVYAADIRLCELKKDAHYDPPSEHSFVDLQIAEAELSEAQVELTMAQQYRLPENT